MALKCNILSPYININVFFQVGYGDIYPQTDMGKVFIVLYMMGALAMFANFVPEMGRLIGDRPK